MGEGDQTIRKDSMIVVTGCVPPTTGVSVALPEQADGDHDLFVDPLSAFYVGDVAVVGGDLPGVLDLFAVALAGMAVEFIADEDVPLWGPWKVGDSGGIGELWSVLPILLRTDTVTSRLYLWKIYKQ